MKKRLLSLLRQGLGLSEPEPELRRGAADVLLLRWVVLSVGVLAVLVGLQACRLFVPLNEWQLLVLAGDPFYLSAADAQVSLLSHGATFGACVCLTLYMAAVLLRMPRLGQRNHLCLLAAVAVGLPGVMCVLWHGVLYVAQPLVCVLLLWLAVVPGSMIRRFFV